MIKHLTIFFCCFAVLQASGQDTATLPKKLTINGYIKNLQTLSFDQNFDHLISGNLLHNRLNVKWKPSGKLTAVTEIRSRLFWGEQVKVTPGFAAQLRNDNEKLNLQQVWIDKPSLVLHTNVERLYADWSNEKWNIRLGRQRINWGITTNWNPNDIFNTYNFLDFDYEERPGIDGAKIEHTFSSGLKTALAYTNTGKKEGTVAAIKYAVNKWNYDMQLITGWYKNHPTIGAGWAGPVKDAGFKGEAQYFFAGGDSAGHFNISLEADYMFKKGWYANIGVLYNSQGLYQPVSNWQIINLKLSPENLMPTKWNILATTNKTFTPLLSANISLLFAPGTNLLILFPAVQYNLAANLDVNLVWQSFFVQQAQHFEAENHQCFLRFKWSF
ncbi:hypothetical protein QWZ08_07765 [Ferruginibacter paludis]|uniref:hypothetical protein n=1 Tax=Ferruginibacter paludis TaxID=1310417 RepID=UPI0025B49ACD|nr:hypothetical protein [Ferruginibacter paludis]MDN3655517.1 hypothetical protein [Ferruginibacter paludis]